MTTANIILAACLVVLCGIAVYLIIRYLWKYREANALFDQVESAIKDLNNDSFDAMHVGYSVQTEVPFADAPDVPKKEVLKAMKSGMGYKAVSALKDYIKKVEKDGNARYELDVYVIPCEECEEENAGE